MLKTNVLFSTARKGISILCYISILRRIHIPVRSANRLHKNIMLLRESLMKLNIQYKVLNTCAATYFFIVGSTYAYMFDGLYSIFSVKYDYQKGTDTVGFFKNYFTWVWVFLQRNDRRCWVMQSVPILLPVQGSLYSGKFWVLFSLKYLKLLAIMTYAQVLFLFFFFFSFCFEYCFKPPKMNCILSKIS